MLPSIFGESLFDDWMGFPFRSFEPDVDRKLYGKHAAQVMKTDLKEHDEGYEHQERYEGSMTRSFYIGENVKEEDVQAKFEDGVLTLDFPKEKPVALPERKTIQIQS